MKNLLIVIFLSSALAFPVTGRGTASENGAAAILFSSNVSGELEACG